MAAAGGGVCPLLVFMGALGGVSSAGRIGALTGRLAGAVDGRLQQQEAMHLVAAVDVPGGHLGRTQAPRAGESLVPRRVGLRGDDQRRRQAAEIGGAQQKQVRARRRRRWSWVGVVDRPAAAVEVQRHRQPAARVWPVPAHRDAAQRLGDEIVPGCHHLDTRRAGRQLAPPGIGYRQGEQRGEAGGLHRLQQRPGLRVESCHVAPAFAGLAVGGA